MRTHAPTRKPGRRRSAALAAIGAVVVAALTLITPAASAAAPDNDSWEHATEVTALPFEDSGDTTDATTDPVNPPDLGRYRFHSVWYHVNLPADAAMLMSTAGTEYTHKVTLFEADSATQSPAEWTKLKADRGYKGSTAGRLQWVSADTDYFVVIGARRGYPVGTAQLVLRAPAQVDIALADPAVYDPIDGSALLDGTISSDLPTEVYLEIELRQLVGERVVRGQGRKHMFPTSDPTPWQMRISGEYGFKVGLARIISSRVRVYDQGVRIPAAHFVQDTITLQ